MPFSRAQSLPTAPLFGGTMTPPNTRGVLHLTTMARPIPISLQALTQSVSDLHVLHSFHSSTPGPIYSTVTTCYSSRENGVSAVKSLSSRFNSLILRNNRNSHSIDSISYGFPITTHANVVDS